MDWKKIEIHADRIEFMSKMELKHFIESTNKIVEDPNVAISDRTEARNALEAAKKEYTHRVSGLGYRRIISSPMGGQPKE